MVQGGLDGGGPGETGGGGRRHFFVLQTMGTGGETGGGGSTILTGLFINFGVDGSAVVSCTFAVETKFHNYELIVVVVLKLSMKYLKLVKIIKKTENNFGRN